MMKTLKRLTTSIGASFGFLMDQVENHEALVNSAIREVQESASRAKVQLARVKHDGARIKKKLLELRDAESKWAERAVKVSATDEKKALECVKRHKRLQAEIAYLEGQDREHSKVQVQLMCDLRLIDEKLIALKRKRNTLATRQSRAEALRSLEAEDSSLLSEIDDILDRWEVKVTQYEMQGSCSLYGFGGEEMDLEEEFIKEEEEVDLKACLETLVEQAAKSQAAQ